MVASANLAIQSNACLEAIVGAVGDMYPHIGARHIVCPPRGWADAYAARQIIIFMLREWGGTNSEVAKDIGCDIRTVERAVASIRARRQSAPLFNAAI